MTLLFCVRCGRTWSPTHPERYKDGTNLLCPRCKKKLKQRSGVVVKIGNSGPYSVKKLSGNDMRNDITNDKAAKRRAYMGEYMRKRRATERQKAGEDAEKVKALMANGKMIELHTGGWCPGKGGPEDNPRLYLPICKTCECFTSYPTKIKEPVIYNGCPRGFGRSCQSTGSQAAEDDYC